MKKVILGLLTLGLASSAMASKPTGTGQIGSGNISLSERDFAGSYIVGRLAIEGPYYVVQFQINDTLDRIVFRNANMDDVSADNDCVGKGMTLKGQILEVRVRCKSAKENLKFEIDVNGVSSTDLAEGTTVNVRSDATMGQWVPFNIVKRSKSFF